MQPLVDKLKGRLAGLQQLKFLCLALSNNIGLDSMGLANKIVKLRKQLGWSQEQLAEKMDVSRQSVSKWESASSVPDLNRLIMLATIFGVSTDFLLKDEQESITPLATSKEPEKAYINLEQANIYVENKLNISALITKGVVACVCCVIPLFLFLAIAQMNQLGFTNKMATVAGIVCIFALVCIGVYFFIKTNDYKSDIALFEGCELELSYNDKQVFEEKLTSYKSTYYRGLCVGIFLLITSFVPVILAGLFFRGPGITLFMLIMLFLLISVGIYIIAAVASRYEAYKFILSSAHTRAKGCGVSKPAMQFSAFYAPLLIAVYLGWSLWTMDWGITWILWPVGILIYAAVFGVIALNNKEKSKNYN